MAHPCFQCGGECYCHGDIDDVIVSLTPASCDSCGCCQMFDEADYEDEDYEDEFIPCSNCDGHPACEDFGCAYELGLGHTVKREPGNDLDY